MREEIIKVWNILLCNILICTKQNQLGFIYLVQNMKYGNMPAGSRTEKKYILHVNEVVCISDENCFLDGL